MKKIAFLGCGKIGRALLEHANAARYAQTMFIEDPYTEIDGKTVIRTPDEKNYEKIDLVIECATAPVLKEHIEMILKNADLLMFSVTAFADSNFSMKVDNLCQEYGHTVYLPHGAILGLDGIFDGRRIWDSVSIETIKSPESLGREDKCRKVIYEGSTRNVCSLYPRNVNVHAAIAIAGIGLEKTQSKIISDPAVSTNTHIIKLTGNGIKIEMNISSFAAGAVTGAYTPYSACGSLDRICQEQVVKKFV